MDKLEVMKSKKTPIAQWLEKHFIKWQSDLGESRTVTDFAAYLGVSRDSLNNWINRGSKPERYSVDILAAKLDDLTIYSLMGLPEPDPRRVIVFGNWDDVSEEIKDEVASIFQRAKIRRTSETSPKRVEQSHRK